MERWIKHLKKMSIGLGCLIYCLPAYGGHFSQQIHNHSSLNQTVQESFGGGGGSNSSLASEKESMSNLIDKAFAGTNDNQNFKGQLTNAVNSIDGSTLLKVAAVLQLAIEKFASESNQIEVQSARDSAGLRKVFGSCLESAARDAGITDQKTLDDLKNWAMTFAC